MVSVLLKAVLASFWITGDYVPPAETNEAAFFEAAPNPVVSTTFACRGPVKKALWRVAAPHGRISVSWKLENGQLKVEKTLPRNGVRVVQPDRDVASKMHPMPLAGAILFR